MEGVVFLQHAVKVVSEGDYGIDPDKILLFGGSHGGFLVSHLAAQFPVHSFILAFVAWGGA